MLKKLANISPVDATIFVKVEDIRLVKVHLGKRLPETSMNFNKV